MKLGRHVMFMSMFSIVLPALSGCGDNEVNVHYIEKNLDEEAHQKLVTDVQELVKQHQLNGLNNAAKQLPTIESPIAQLGMQLFFSKSLSGDMDTACASCHHPFLGGGDALPLSIGVAAIQPNLLGPGRLHDAGAVHADGGPTVPRNAPSTFNIAFYNQALFHDGRVQTLSDSDALNGLNEPLRTPDSPFATADNFAGTNLTAAQARFPVTSKEEMRGFNLAAGESNQVLREALQRRLRGETNELSKNEWLSRFATAFNRTTDQVIQDNILSFDNVAFALGEYQRSQVLINSPWSQFVQGNTSALTDEQLKGAKLFYSTKSQGGFDCVACHSGDFMTDEQFHIIAMPQIGRGKGDGEDGSNDFGRFRETNVETDKFAFRTPHLTNIEVTAPYGHDGAFATLEAVIEHHLNPEVSIANYDPSDVQPGIQTTHWVNNTNQALDVLKMNMDAGRSLLTTIDFSVEQITQLVAFLKAQTDPCTKDHNCLIKWVPAPTMDADNTLLIAEFQE